MLGQCGLLRLRRCLRVPVCPDPRRHRPPLGRLRYGRVARPVGHRRRQRRLPGRPRRVPNRRLRAPRPRPRRKPGRGPTRLHDPADRGPRRRQRRLVGPGRGHLRLGPARRHADPEGPRRRRDLQRTGPRRRQRRLVRPGGVGLRDEEQRPQIRPPLRPRPPIRTQLWRDDRLPQGHPQGHRGGQLLHELVELRGGSHR